LFVLFIAINNNNNNLAIVQEFLDDRGSRLEIRGVVEFSCKKWKEISTVSLFCDNYSMFFVKEKVI